MTKAKDHCGHLALPDSGAPGAAALRLFVNGQYELDGASMGTCFAEDAVFNGLIYKERGNAAIVALYTNFLRDFMESFEVEAVAPVLHGQWIMLTKVLLKGAPQPMYAADLVTLDGDGRICRIDNCFDVKKVGPPAENAEDAKQEKEEKTD